MSMDDEDKVKKLNLVGEALKTLRQPYEAHFRELGDNFMPRRSRFTKGKDHRSSEHINRRMLNSTPRRALRTLQSGLHSGVTSPARPWFRLIATDPDLRQNQAVKEHLSVAQREMQQMMRSSGLYTMLHILWGDLGLYGTDAAILEDDFQHGLYGQALVPGEYYLGANARGMNDMLYREYRMTVKQVVAKFVFKNNPRNKPDWDAVSRTIKNLWDQTNYSEKVPVRHLIMPRSERDPRSARADNKPFMSTYWEGEESRQVLGDMGYDQNPILSSRWEAQGTDTYGASPAMDTLSESKELQRKERDKAEAIRRMNRPPMNAPVELRNTPYSLQPEAVNFMTHPEKGLVPSYQITPPIADLRADIEDSENRINDGMYANLFLMIANLDRRQITAREIDERHEEKLLGLGPVLERQHREKLAVLIRRAYNVVVDTGRVPPLPPEMDGIDVSIDYVSTLGQALKAVATGGIERLYGFIGNLSGVDDTVLDTVDNDAAIFEYADMVGVPANIVRAKEQIEAVRGERAARLEQQQSVDQAEQVANVAQKGAQAASVLADTGQPRGSRDILRELGIR